MFSRTIWTISWK